MTPTKHNWSTMTPRERDALVATEVMGWSADTEYPNDFWSVPADPKRFHNTFPFSRAQDGWNPSTSIADAFEVIDKMRGRGLPFELHCYDNLWAAWLNEDSEAICQNASEACCLAALRACGVEVGE